MQSDDHKTWPSDACAHTQVLKAADLAAASDASQDAIDFILVMLAKEAPGHFELCGTTMPSFKVGFYKQTAAQLAEDEPIVAALVATGRERNGVYSGTMQAVARAAGQRPDAVQHTLQRLAGAGQVHLEADKEPAVAVRVHGAAPPGLARSVHARLHRLQQHAVCSTTSSICMCWDGVE